MADQTTTIPNGWKITMLGEVVDITSSKRIFADEYKKSGIPFFRGKEISEKFSGNEISTELFISEEKYEDIKNKYGVPEENDILLTSVGTLGNPYLVEKDLKFYFKDGNLTWFRNYKDIEPRFLFYWIISPQGKETLSYAKIGSTQEAYTIVKLKMLPCVIPPLPEQRAIAAVLSSSDNKIELLREQNKTLEAIAQAIFKEWFMNLNFPNAEGKPYKSSGGKMIDSELGKIPKKWKVFALSEIVGMINGYSYKGSELKEKGYNALVTLKSFDRKGGFQTRGFKPFIGNPKPEQEVFLGDLVIAHTDLTQDAEVLGNPAFIFDNGGYKKIYITMDLVKIFSKNTNIALDFYYYLMNASGFKKHCVGYSNGTTVLHLSKRAIPEYKIALPDDLSLIIEFSKIAHATTQKIINNFSQIQTLSRLRDTLLPKLMKGEVRVKGFKD